MTDRGLSREGRAIAKSVVEQLSGRGRVDEAFYTPNTLAAKLSVTPRTVYTMLRKGVIPSYRVEGTRRIDPNDVDAYLAARRDDQGYDHAKEAA